MDISSKVFSDKIKQLRPDLQSSVTPHMLNKICNEPAVQPFLKWFCSNITNANVLSNEELQMKNKLESTGEWLDGEELDNALQNATQDCPELLNIVTSDDLDLESFHIDLDTIKIEYQEDKDYIDTLKSSIKNLKEVENKLDDDIEEHENLFEKTRIETRKIYDDCSVLLKEFDNKNRKFSEDIEHLLSVYADAAENKGAQILWTQMPIDLFVKQMQLYNDCLGVHLKRQFETSDKEDQKSDSDYSILINDSKSDLEEKIYELMLCKTNFITSKINMIEAEVKEQSFTAMLEYARDIYNNGNVKIPEKLLLQDEILELTRKRDFLEESTKLLQERQLYEAVEQSAELEITKILKNNASAKLQRRRIRCEKLKNILTFALEHGHAHSDLLCILMEMQYRCVKEVRELVADARHYLATEYSLSCMRSENMQQQQEEYNSVINAPKCYNSFDRLFVSMMCGSETLENPLSAALKKYNELISDNNKKKQAMIDEYINTKLSRLELMKKNISLRYIDEVSDEPTRHLKPIPYEIDVRYTETFNNVQSVQSEVAEIRSKLKEKMRSDIDLEREKKILWQWFLADPDTLRTKYNEIKARAEQSHFGTTSIK